MYVIPRRLTVAVAVPDHNWAGEPPLGEPARRVVVVLNALPRQLEGGALGSPTVADTEDVVPTPVEGETSKTEPGQHWWQKARRADIEVHRVAVEQHYCTARLGLRQVKGTVQRQGIGCD